MPGKGELLVPIPYVSDYYFGNPTVFNYKGANDKYYNSCHYARIDLLNDMYAMTGSEKAKKYMNKWADYVDEWKNDEIWNSEDISYEPYH